MTRAFAIKISAALFIVGALCLSQVGAQIPNVKLQSQCTGNDANTKLLVHFDGVNNSTTVPDTSISGAHGNATVSGSAKLSTATSRFGSASLSLGAAGNKLTFPASSDWSFGTADFTFDMWSQVDSGAGTQSFSESSGSGWQFQVGTTSVTFAAEQSSVFGFVRTSTISLSTSRWYHFAYVRASGVYRTFIDGVSQSFSTSTGADGLNVGPASNTEISIGDASVAGVPLMDEFRISNIGRWSANFTPPNQPYCP